MGACAVQRVVIHATGIFLTVFLVQILYIRKAHAKGHVNKQTKTHTAPVIEKHLFETLSVSNTWKGNVHFVNSIIL